MRHVYNRAQLVAGADHLGTEVGQTTMFRRSGLNVAEFDHAVMDELQMPQPMLRERSFETVQPAFKEVRAFGRHHDRRAAARPCGVPQRGAVRGHGQALLRHQRCEPAECFSRVGGEFARQRRAEGLYAFVRRHVRGRRVGDHGQGDERRSPPAQRPRDRLERAQPHPGQDRPPGMAVQIHRCAARYPPTRRPAPRCSPLRRRCRTAAPSGAGSGAASRLGPRLAVPTTGLRGDANAIPQDRRAAASASARPSGSGQGRAAPVQ